MKMCVWWTLILAAALAASPALAADKAATAAAATPSCPQCGSAADVIPIIYGYPSEELMKAADRGEVALGGCIVGDDAPRWRCKKCGRDFNDAVGK